MVVPNTARFSRRSCLVLVWVGRSLQFVVCRCLTLASFFSLHGGAPPLKAQTHERYVGTLNRARGVTLCLKISDLFGGGVVVGRPELENTNRLSSISHFPILRRPSSIPHPKHAPPSARPTAASCSFPLAGHWLPYTQSRDTNMPSDRGGTTSVRPCTTHRQPSCDVDSSLATEITQRPTAYYLRPQGRRHFQCPSVISRQWPSTNQYGLPPRATVP